jgi:hypothetical protein
MIGDPMQDQSYKTWIIPHDLGQQKEEDGQDTVGAMKDSGLISEE